MICQVRLHRKHNRLEKLEVPDAMAIFGNSECNGIVHKANSIPQKAHVKIKHSVFLLSVWHL